MPSRDGTRAHKGAPLSLTPRQQEVIRLMGRGLTNGQIADDLGITLDGAKFHVGEIIQKLGANSREEAVEIWMNRPHRWQLPTAAAFLKFGAAAIVAGVGLGGVIVWAALLHSGSSDDPGSAVAAPNLNTPTTVSGGTVIPGVTALPTRADANLVPCPPAAPTTPLPNGSAVDWVDFVIFDGVSYLGGGWTRPARIIDTASLGEPYGRVQVNVSETSVNPNAARTDCEAAFIPAGAVLFRVDGYDPHFRIATRDGRLYEAYRKQGAAVAGEFIDIDGKVETIVIRDSENELKVGTIGDPSVVTALVDQLLSATFDDAAASSGTTAYQLEFILDDGTTWAATFWPDSNRIWPGIFVPESFTATVRAAMK